MGLLFSVITMQLYTIHEVLLAAKLVVWDGPLNFIDYFIQPWRNLFWFCFNVYVYLWSEIGSLTVKILVLPFRIYGAIQKEDMMEEELQQVRKLHTESKERVAELECELEQVLDECSQYKDDLEQVLDECSQYKDDLEKVEGEKKAILKKFQVLQLQVMHLKEENDILKAQQERPLKDNHERNVLVVQKNNMGNNRFNMESHENKHTIERDHKHDFSHVKYPWIPALLHITRMTPLNLGHKHEGAACKINKCVANHHTVRYEAWEAAVFSSLFSVFLTLLVGTIAWQAQDPCIPLVVAVFMVVCMSLKKVAQFLLSVCNGPGVDVVALLSFNWFMLGTLAYPVLPRIASIVAPYGTKFRHWF